MISEEEFLAQPAKLAELMATKTTFAPYYRVLKEKLEASDLRALYHAVVPPKGKLGSKYLQLAMHHHRHLNMITALKLRHPPPLRILDLAAGPGQFLYAARIFGHDGVALERPFAGRSPRSIDYRVLMDFYGVSASEQAIRPQVPLVIDQHLARRFDRVTAFGILFIHNRADGLGAGEYWTAPDYAFLFNDLKDNLLVAGGLVTMQFHGHLYGSPREDQDARIAAYYTALGTLLEPMVVEKVSPNAVTLDPSRMAQGTLTGALPVVRHRDMAAEDD